MSSTIEDVESVAPQSSPIPVEEAQSVALPPASNFWHAPWIFAVHGFVATSIFLLIAGFAIGLDVLVGWLKQADLISLWIILPGFEVAEILLFATDLFLFVIFLYRAAFRAYRDMKQL